MKKISYIKDMKKWKEGFSFYIPIKVRFSETDMFGHVNNVSPFIYFEEARIEFLKSFGLFGEGREEAGVPVVADLQCDYLRQMYFDDELRLYVKLNDIGNTSFDMHYMALNQENEICLTGRGRMVYIDAETGKPVSITAAMKDKLAVKS